jgi:hypothetical protein
MSIRLDWRTAATLLAVGAVSWLANWVWAMSGTVTRHTDQIEQIQKDNDNRERWLESLQQQVNSQRNQ